MDDYQTIKDRKTGANIALAIWPAGRAAIGRKKCYWASVPAEVTLIGSRI